MYEVNGIDLSGSQYRELKALVELPDDATREERAKKTMDSDDGARLYGTLLAHGLIDGAEVWGGIIFQGVTQDGVDFVMDYAEKEKDERDRLWSDKRFQIGLSIGTLVGGGVISVVVSLVTNWLMNR